MSRPTVATIDLHALTHNLEAVKRFAPRSKVLAMVKADGYGHGLIRVASACDAADAFGVACIEEALRLREAGIQHRIVLMQGPLTIDEIALAVQHQFELVLHHPSQITMLATHPPARALLVWLKIETGMHRLGFSAGEFKAAYQWCQQHPEIISRCHLMSHFAQAEADDPSFTQQQLDIFSRLTADLPEACSLANSAGIIGWPSAHKQWIRPGIMLYGISPIEDKTGLDYGLKPVMTLQSKIIAINDCMAGEHVGYGGTWVAPANMKVAVAAIGYGDGYPRHISSGAPVLVNGNVFPVVGRVSMDMITIDCSQYPGVKIGDDVVLWGPGLPVERVAAAANTIAYECITQVTARVPMQILS